MQNSKQINCVVCYFSDDGFKLNNTLYFNMPIKNIKPDSMTERYIVTEFTNNLA